jgi:hypothetical protein
VNRSIHGVHVSVTGSLPAGLLAELLDGFPEGERARRPDLVISLEPAADVALGGGRPLFFHGSVRAAEHEGALLVTDGHSSARVAPGGGRIELSVAPTSLRDRHAFEHVLALIAVVLALRHRGLFHLHAAALVRSDGRSVLVVGQGGSGKSTLALTLLEHSGLRYLGDDTVLLASRGNGVTVVAWPRDFHVADETAAAFPRLAALLGPGDAPAGKRRLDPRRAFPGRERMEAGAPALVLVPVLAGGRQTTFAAVSAAEAMGALIESSALVAIEGLPGAAEQLALQARALRDATCLRVRLGADALEAPGNIAAMLPLE